MTLPRPTIALILALMVLPWLGVACAKPFLVHPAVQSEDPPPEPTDAPILVQPTEAIFVAGSGTFSHTPTVTQGENLTFDIVSGTLPTNLTEESNFNTSTGQLSGTVSSSAGSGTYLVRATTPAFTAVTETPNEFYDIWVRWHIYTSTGTISDGDGSPIYLDVAGRLYTVTEDLHFDASGLVPKAANVGIKGDGFTAYYDQATPIVLADAGFEEVDDWDFTNAPNASQFQGSYTGQTLFEGDYSLRFDTPTADDEYVESDGTVVLEPETAYAVSGMVYFGESDPGITPYIDLVGTGEEDTVRAEKTGNTAQAAYFFHAQFVTPAGTPTYKVRVGIEGGANLTTRDIYFDSIRITRDRPAGVVVGPQSWDSSTPEDVTSYGTASGTTISDLGIECGADKGWRGHAVMTVASTNVCAIGCDMDVNGASASCWFLHDTNASGSQYYLANSLTSTNTISSSRANSHGAVLFLFSGVAAHNDLQIAPINGIFTHLQATSIVAFNTAQSQATFTNNFAYSINGSDSQAYRNTLSNTTAPYESRGIGMAPTVQVFGNTITSRDGGSSQEYGGYQISGAHINQQEVRTGGIVAHETYTIVGSAGSCFRVGPDNSVASTGTRLYDHCTGIVDAASPEAEGTGGYTPACIKTINVELDNVEFVDCTFETNNAFLTASRTDGWSGTTGTLLIERPSIEYVDGGLSWAFAWIIGYPNNQDFACCVRDPVYVNSGSRSYIDSQPRNLDGGTGSLSGTIAIWEENTCTVTLADNGSPLANTAVVVTDEQGNEVFNDETDAEGQITFVAKNWQWNATTRTSYKTHTFSVVGYADATADLTDTNKTPTVPLTAE